ncbi:GtrA family protein [Atlantibacter subterraneus]|uniref:GtrA family protein n=1 Tax=Atlantibacter subterraneus TaxID=255519 RepID=UPI00289D6F4F|nr:GtrA family protein [Atlantibacter subterranea]
MLKLFTRYISVGLLNTAIHWIIFGTCYALGVKQSLSNLVAFIIAVTFSFFLNAKYTFSSNVTPIKYLLYLTFMGAMAMTVGTISDNFGIHPILTLILFSTISVIMGFIYSKMIVFRK